MLVMLVAAGGLRRDICRNIDGASGRLGIAVGEGGMVFHRLDQCLTLRVFALHLVHCDFIGATGG